MTMENKAGSRQRRTRATWRKDSRTHNDNHARPGNLKKWRMASRHLSWVLLFVSAVAGMLACSNTRKGTPRVLVFSKTAAFYHHSIPAGNKALMKLGAEHGFDVDTTTNAEWFNEDTLKNYSAVVFLSTTGDVL